MPLSPTPAQSEASRANGALSRGPVTSAGKARSTANAPAPSHGLRGTGPFALLPGEDPAAFDDLLADLLATYAPADAAERHWVEEVAHTMWRRRRLHALEARVLANLLSDEEGGPPPVCPRSPRWPAISVASSATYASPTPSWPASARIASPARPNPSRWISLPRHPGPRGQHALPARPNPSRRLARNPSARP